MHPNATAPAGTVMIVDDVPANLAFLSDALEEAGYRVLVATDGLTAIEQLRYARPDAILLDVMMPGLDGFETCRRLKADPATEAIPVIFMTALSELDDLLRGFEEGAVDYVVKPVRHQEVLARIAAHLARARLIRRAEDALAGSGLAALAIDGLAVVTWATPAGTKWLAECSGAVAAPGAPLPQSLAEWARKGIADGAAESAPYTAQRAGRKYSARLGAGGAGGEYLLLLQDAADDWDLDSLKAHLGLTPREAEILMWIARGKTNREVSLILGGSPRTINKHLEHIFEKLGVATRAAAVAVALDRVRVAGPT